MPSQLRTALLVDSDRLQLSTLETIVEAHGCRGVPVREFAEARRLVRSAPPEFVITNLRLGAFNGIHLAFLAKLSHPGAAVLVYARDHDRMLAAEAQAAGAFYQRQDCMPFSLPAFLTAALPQADRRDASVVDRRAAFRGGRRSTDISVFHSATVI